ncbi:hypothetical protein JXB11_02545 [Candidatus Woesearchaeota archaeon]|nr:hypothetical protein [Candidatus Woesearchaeota archaeon]
MPIIDYLDDLIGRIEEKYILPFLKVANKGWHKALSARFNYNSLYRTLDSGQKEVHVDFVNGDSIDGKLLSLDPLKGLIAVPIEGDAFPNGSTSYAIREKDLKSWSPLERQ